EAQNPRYWSEQLTLPVRFREAVEAAVEASKSDRIVFVEIGPQKTLINLTAQILSTQASIVTDLVNMVERGEDTDEGSVMEKLRRCERLCSAPLSSAKKQKWNHQSFEWRKLSHPLVDTDEALSLLETGSSTAFCEKPIRTGTLSMLRDHVVWGTPIIPGVAFIDAMLSAALALTSTSLVQASIELHDVAILQPMILHEGPESWGQQAVKCPTSPSSIGLALKLEVLGERTSVALSSTHVGGVSAEARVASAVTHAEGWFSMTEAGCASKPPTLDVANHTKHMVENMRIHYNASEAYEELRRCGLEYGQCFQTIHDIIIADASALVELRFQHEVSDFDSSFILHPSILDGCVQSAVLLALLHMPSWRTALVPVGASDIRVWDTIHAWSSSYWADVNMVDGGSLTSESEGAVVSITLFDDSANVVAQIGMMRLKPVTVDQVFPMERDLGRGMLWGLKWVESPVVPQSQKASKQKLHWLVRGVEDDATTCLENTMEVFESTRIELHYSSKTLLEAEENNVLDDLDAAVHVAGVCQRWTSAVDYLADVLAFLQAISRQIDPQKVDALPLIIIVVAGTSAVLPGEQSVHPLLAGVRGLCRTARLEMEAIANRRVPLLVVDLDPSQVEQQSPVNVIRQVAYALRSSHLMKTGSPASAREQSYIETELVVRKGRIFSPQLTPSGVQLLPAIRTPSPIGMGDTVIVTGGLGGLGLVVAHWLAEQKAKSVILLSRTGKPPQHGTTAQLWQQLRERHNTTQFVVQRCDVACASQVDALFCNIKRGYLVCESTGMLCYIGPLDGIFHSAGVLVDRPLLQQDSESLRCVIEPKVDGAWNLHNCLGKHSMESNLRYFVMFSSSVGLLGNAGQANYAAANCCLDELALYRRSLGLVAHSIQWGPWVEQGMAAQLQERFSKTGFGGISNSLGLLTLTAVLQQNSEPVVGCQPIYWRRFLNRYRFATPTAFEHFARLAINTATNTESQRGDTRVEGKQLSGRKQNNQQKNIQQVVVAAAKSVLNGAANVEVDAPLQELGIDSLGAIEFRDAIQNALNVRLSATVLFDHPSIEALTKFLEHEVSDTDNGEAATASIVESLSPVDSPPGSATAVVGIACRFPASDDDPRGFWQMLSKGTDCISKIPENRFDIDTAYDPNKDATGKMYVREGGFIKSMDLFDNRFFHVPDGEAEQMDPRQRVALELAFEAAVDAGYGLKQLEGLPIGVFVGAMNHENVFEGDAAISAFTATSNAVAILANRISYFYALTGPSMSVDTACSSSLVAICLSLPALLSDQSPAIVLGVNALLSPTYFIQTCKAHMLSIDGRCKTFDASANGYVRSEGCGAVLLQALPRESTNPNSVYAWIRGAANNHVGRSASLTAPNGPAQQAVIRAALRDARIQSPAD
ncbi:uncharacterized protein LOC113146661, partial [Cyclospora cayetanensis]|uniref:Uncharacterized protein LOC113146661 n=1 Tax=Cyclospora cayetanensis TaxID=88456 RepID=A0A6P6RRR0_9EIME